MGNNRLGSATGNMEAWLRHLDTDTPSVAPFQLKWEQQRLVLSRSGLKWAAEASNGGAHVRGKEGGPAPVQLRHGIERSEQRHEEDSAEEVKGKRESSRQHQPREPKEKTSE